ncbi:hypothetical protein EYB25_000664 [Talaromyces marneffei]|uniref:Uncharacterized protein n=1 Tax=Talaromyces marneffei (strain ATCC 18224 / CBS 334.59 / QM 7333) TaxID=441960 RepID=B6Q585_TALMQ|nr:uncharacterized protein EYB26_001671 [Talaromyces marneffei]EEA28404.1 conserved hypothetical protein [Talaromyces marneffei ATCC 18224]KAE8555965.1 hypothetical protein EYB25_000664 [Talaromyces marneffei]QGA14019.1 hypothetical protein EYB26_001671 [Talaromyces marneffei]
MPKLSTPVLTVDAAKIQQVDTANTQSLHGMWLVFSKCADYMEEGRRLENLTWRLWTRETFCVAPVSESDTSAIPLLRAESSEMPPLSASVESVASVDEDSIESHIKPGPIEVKPTVVGDDALMLAKEKHITSSDLERMVLNIKERKALEPFPPSAVVDVTPRAASPPAATPQEPERTTEEPIQRSPTLQSAESCSTATAPENNDSDCVTTEGSDTSASSSGVLPAKPILTKTPSIVRGFSPSQISSSYRSSTRLASEQNASAKMQFQQKLPPSKRKGGMFTLGGSSGDDESSFEERMGPNHTINPHRSSLSEELSRHPTSDAMMNGAKTVSPEKKTSFRHDVESTIKPIEERVYEDEDAIETDDSDAEPSESAIEDEDEEDWEDSVTESGQSSVDDKELFQRVDSRPNLVSRPSLLTMMMHQPAKMGMPTRSTPALQRSRVTPPNGPSTGASPDDDENLTMKGRDVPRSKPIIVKSTAQGSGAHSPRTTRRNMLATELTESLRRHLLWERQQKNTTATAVFKRRHTTHDMANLKEYPGPKGAAVPGGQRGTTDGSAKDTSKNSSWNNHNDYGPWEYHVKGW